MTLAVSKGKSLFRLWDRLHCRLSSIWNWGGIPWYGNFNAATSSIEWTKPNVLSVFPHDRVSVQGLACFDGVLFESRGQYGRSALCRLSSEGSLLTAVDLPECYYAEGIAVCCDELLQLTWREGVAIRYDLNSLEQKGFYFYRGEGWGLTRHPSGFLMTNGSDKILELDCRFDVVRIIRVRLAGRPVWLLNDLEYAEGMIYANVNGAEFLLEIKYPEGTVSRIIDCRELLERERKAGRVDVLNGVAYCVNSSAFYLTGKAWRNIYRVAIC